MRWLLNLPRRPVRGEQEPILRVRRQCTGSTIDANIIPVPESAGLLVHSIDRDLLLAGDRQINVRVRNGGRRRREDKDGDTKQTHVEIPIQKVTVIENHTGSIAVASAAAATKENRQHQNSDNHRSDSDGNVGHDS